MGTEIDFAKSPEYLERRTRLRSQYATELDAENFQTGVADDGGITFSLTRFGLGGVYADISMDEIEYHLDNDDLQTYEVRMVKIDGEVVERCLVEAAEPEYAIEYAQRHNWGGYEFQKENYDNVQYQVSLYVKPPATIEEAVDQMIEEES